MAPAHLEPGGWRWAIGLDLVELTHQIEDHPTMVRESLGHSAPGELIELCLAVLYAIF